MYFEQLLIKQYLLNYILPHTYYSPYDEEYDLAAIDNIVPFDIEDVISYARTRVCSRDGIVSIKFLINDEQWHIEVCRYGTYSLKHKNTTGLEPCKCKQLYVKDLNIFSSKFNIAPRQRMIDQIKDLSDKINTLFGNKFVVKNDILETIPSLLIKSGTKYNSSITLSCERKDNISLIIQDEEFITEKIWELNINMDDYILRLINIEFEYQIYKNICIIIHVITETMEVNDYYSTIGELNAQLEFSHKLQQYDSLAKRLNIDLTDIKDPYNHLKKRLRELKYSDF